MSRDAFVCCRVSCWPVRILFTSSPHVAHVTYVVSAHTCTHVTSAARSPQRPEKTTLTDNTHLNAQCASGACSCGAPSRRSCCSTARSCTRFAKRAAGLIASKRLRGSMACATSRGRAPSITLYSGTSCRAIPSKHMALTTSVT